MNKLIITVFLFFSLLSFGQTSNDKVIYLDSLGKDSDSDNYFSKEIIKDYFLEKTDYSVEKYSRKKPKDVLVAKYFVNNKYHLTLNGEYKTFHQNGKIKEIYHYKNDTLSGSDKYYYDNGKLSTDGYYKIIDKKSKYFLKNYWNKKGVQKVKNGNGVFEYFIGKEGIVMMSGNVKNEMYEGLWKCNNKAFPKYEKFYEKGDLIKGKIIKSDTLIREYVGESTPANPEGGINNFRAKIGTRINLSGFDVDLNCRVSVRFVVDTDGSIVDVKITECDYPPIEANVYRAFRNLPKWESGIYNGQEVKQYFTIPFAISLRKDTE